MNTALHENTGATQGQGLLYFLVYHVLGQNISFGIALHTIEGTEGTELLTDIRIVDIAVNNVTDHVVRMTPHAHPVRGRRQIQQVRSFKERNRFRRSDQDSIFGGPQYGSNVCHRNSSGLADLIIPRLAALS